MKIYSLYLMALLYFFGGINHFINPGYYKAIIPVWLPWHSIIIYVTGALEMVMGILLLKHSTRRFAAWGIIILLIAVFPANIKMMINYIQQEHQRLWLAIVRLPLQFFLVWWAYMFTRKANPLPAAT